MARRLQRKPDFTGDRLTSFRQVFLRHGLPGLAIASLMMIAPGYQTLFLDALNSSINAPQKYMLWCAVILSGLNLYNYLLDRKWNISQFGWIAYLGVLSLWEEWVFRAALPQTLEGLGMTVWVAAGMSAMLFGGIHYFTLRWKWQWCVMAALGGFALSRQMEMHGDLLLITAFHWIATTINTPRPPGSSPIKV